MVDCGNPRCIQDKRSVRKDLMSWSKKIPLLLGLEAVLEQFAGRRLSTLLMQPFNDKKHRKGPAEDWTPEVKCTYCDDCNLKPEPANCDSTSDLDPTPQDSVDPHTPEPQTDRPDTHTEGSDTEQTLVIATLPHITPDAEAHKLDTLTAKDVKATTFDLCPGNTESDHNQSPVVAASVGPVRSKRYNGKRAYSDEELATAISEIQNGKIGTRRASSLYGIPRSTLRNKIFKLESNRQESPLLLDEPDEHLGTLAPPVDATMRYPDLNQYNPFMFISPYMFPAVLPYTFDYLKPPFDPAPPPLSHDINFGNLERRDEIRDEKLEQIRKKHNLATLCRTHEQDDAVLIDPQLLSQPFAQQLKLSILPNLIRKLAQQRLELERSATDFKKSLDELMMARQHDSESSDTDSDHSMKVMPMARHPFSYHQPGHAMPSAFDSLIGSYYNGLESKDQLGKTKGTPEKVKCRESNGDSSEFSSHGSLADVPKRAKSAFSVPGASPSKKVKKERLASSPDDNRSENHPVVKAGDASAAQPVKKTRPKRGQYRKYNSQLLTEAVKSVQRGEMSVHRAGSYYGVPHSTLEYKVKERHLLRQKKVKEAQLLKESGQQQTDDNKSSSESPGLPAPTLKNAIPSNKAPTQSVLFPDWLKQTNAFPSVSPMRPMTSDLSMNTPASELLKKLQQKVKNNATTSLSDGGFFPSGLDLHTDTW